MNDRDTAAELIAAPEPGSGPAPVAPGRYQELLAALEAFGREAGLPDDLACTYATEALALVDAYCDPLGILPDPPAAQEPTP